MPGKYIEFIKAGRYAVPVELTFLPCTIIETNGIEVITSKWMERRHWKETKAMLKPAVESALTHNEMAIIRVSNTHIVNFGQEICLGYMLQATKDNAPFLAVLDAKKNCWTDDEEDEDDEYPILNDFGGRFKNYTQCKVHIIACVLKKTMSNSEDNKRLRMELGIRSDDLRNYFQQASSNANNAGPSSSSSYNCFNQGFSSSSNNGTTSCSNLLSSFDAYCAKANMKKARYARKTKDYVKSCTTTPSWKSTISSTRRQDAFWNRGYRDTKFEDDDTLESDDGSSDGSSDASTDSNVFEKRISSETNDADDDDDDDFSLPDIDSPIKPTPVKKPRTYKRKNVGSIISPKRSVNHYEKDIFGSSDSSSASKTPRNKKKQTPLTYVGFSTPGIQSFEDAISTASYRNPTTKKTKTTTLSYSTPKVSKKVQKSSPSTIRPRKPITTNATSSPAKKASSSYQTDDFLHPSRSSTDSYLKKVPNTSVEESNYRTGSYFFSPVKRHESLFTSKDYTTSALKSSPSAASSPLDENKSSDSNCILGLDRVLTVAAKKSYSEESAEEEKQRKRKSNSSTDITVIGSLSKPKKSKHKDKDRMSESPQKSHDGSRREKHTSEGKVEFDPEMPVLDKMVDNDVPESNKANILAPRLSASSSKAISFERTSESVSRKNNSETSQSNFPYMYSSLSQSTHSSNKPTTTLDDIISDDIDKPKKAKKKKHKDKEKKRRDEKDIGQVNSGVAAKIKAQTVPPPVSLPGSENIVSSKTYLTREYSIKEDSSLVCSAISSKVINIEGKDTGGFKHLKTINSQLIRHKDACTSTTADAKLDEVVIELLRQNAVINYEVDTSDNEDSRGIRDTAILMTEYDTETGEEQVKSLVQLNSRNRKGSVEYSDDDEEFFDKTIVPLCASQNVERSFHMPAFGPTDDYADKDLFCFNKSSFDRPRSLSVPVIANNKVSQATNTDDEEAISMPPPTKRPPRSPKKPIDTTAYNKIGVPERFNSEDSEKEQPKSEILTSTDSSRTEKQLSTYELLTHATIFRQGMGYLQKLSSNSISAKEITDKLGIEAENEEEKDDKESKDQELMPPPRPKRELSPDICCLTPESKIDQIRISFKQSRPRTLKTETDSTEDGLEGELTPKVEAETDVEENSGQELVRELLSRHNTLIDDQHEDSGDDRNLSQRSVCMTNFVPGYVQKSLIYKKHSKLIQSMTLAELVQNFDSVRVEIKGIYEGIVSSTRHTLYLQGLTKKNLLKELNISIPFTSQQGMCLISFLYDFLFPEPDDRLQFTEYITFVMLPETYIRIYARVTDQTYDMAQLEMRFGACYDESTLEQS